MGERRIVGGTQSTVTTAGGERTPSFPLLAIGAAVLVAVLAGTVLLNRTQAGTALPAQTAVPIATVLPPTALPSPTALPPTLTPSESEGHSYRALIEELIRKGQYKQARTMAEAALSVPDLRADDRRILTGYIVTAGMKDISTQVSRPTDRASQQSLADTYLSLAERATGAGVTIDTPLEVAARAFASSQFVLARIAIERALAEHAFDPQIDRDVTRLYVSTLFGLGKAYTTAPADSPVYVEGLRWLVTSDRIADAYETGQSEAEAVLQQLGYTDKARWPPAFETQVLR